jgi:hypothetical protein
MYLTLGQVAAQLGDLKISRVAFELGQALMEASESPAEPNAARTE